MEQYEIIHETTNGKDDFMVIYAHNIIDAVKEFEALQRESKDYGIAYTMHSIKSVKRYN